MFQHPQNCLGVPDPGTVPSSVASFSEKNKGMWLELSWKGSSVEMGSLKKKSKCCLNRRDRPTPRIPCFSNR